jgi:hypothetical protein
MQHAEEYLEKTAMEDRTKETVPERNRAKAVSMTDTEPLSCNLHQTRLFQTDHTQFFKIGICPHVVISLEEIHFDASIHQVTKGSKDLDISLGNHITVFIPEIPDVTEKIQRLRLLCRYPAKE